MASIGKMCGRHFWYTMQVAAVYLRYSLVVLPSVYSPRLSVQLYLSSDDCYNLPYTRVSSMSVVDTGFKSLIPYTISGSNAERK